MKTNTSIANCSFYVIIACSFLTVLLSCNSKNKETVNSNNSYADSITQLIDRSKLKEVAKDDRNSGLLKAYALNKLLQNDSLQQQNLLDISYEAYKLKNIPFYKKVNREASKKSLVLKEYFGLAKTHQNEGFYFGRNEVLDSSYYHYHKAFTYYNKIGDKYYSAKMLYNIAFIQSRTKDYIESEEKLFKAISIFNTLEDHKSLYKCYNQLGNIHQELKNYKNSIEFYEKALANLDYLENKKTYREGLYNNIALTYQLQGKYTKAISNLNKALKNDSLQYKKIALYTRLKDNLAYTRLLSGDTLNVKNELLSTLKTRDSMDNTSGVVINSLHLAEYYLITRDTTKALSYAKNAYTLAKSVHNNRDILSSLSLLNIIDKNNSNYYFKAYQKLTDKLQLKERNLRNKFARVRFKTDEHIEEASKQNSEKIMVAAISISIIIILLLLYFVRHQRGKNRELQLETAQQRANENIYNLLLKQQSKLKEGRENERLRISQELHDGVLGKIFATRMRLDFLDVEGADEIQQKYQLYLGELQDVEKEIRIISHELKSELLNDQSDFTQIIAHLVTEQNVVLNFKYQIEEDGTVQWNKITDIVKINCYRIIQEGLHNINKHSKAKNVTIQLSFKNNTLSLNIKDDGIGFDIKKNTPGIGLQNIADRVKKLNGTFVTTSSLEQGSLLSIHIPITVLDTNLT